MGNDCQADDRTSKVVDQLRWYPWIIFGNVATGLALGVLGAIRVASG